MRRRWLLSAGVLLVSTLPEGTSGDQEAKPENNSWLIYLLIIPFLQMAISIVLLLITIQYIYKTSSIIEDINASVQSLARCSVRLGISPRAAKSIYEYARSKPEFRKLLDKDKAEQTQN
ncbi:hypothetical protein Q1695_016125 [Nippostrongylus brasiliensis]|nr:hypothetical protein Q1695_016125 [Nippostrongylus brasiliensis]